MNMQSPYKKAKIAIVSPEKTAYSATFIRAHIEQIDAQVVHLYGVFFPTHAVSGGYELVENSTMAKWFSRVRLRKTYKGLFKDRPLAKFLEKEKIELVLAEFGPTGAEVYDACQLLNIPLIVYFHGFDAYNQGIYNRYGKAYKSMFKYASYLIVVSNNMHDRLVEAGAPAEKMILNPCAPNDEFFNLHPTFDALKFLAVGRFVEKKAPDLTIRAFRQVVDQFPAATLTMVGDGRLLEQCTELANELGLKESIVFYGSAPHEEVLKLFEEAYCFVQHSVVAINGDSEGTPVAVLEAGAAGLPVIATRHAGIKDVVIEGETGLLVDEKDVQGMANCMLALSEDKEKAKRMGLAGRNHINDHYTMTKHIGILNTLIHNLLSHDQ